MQDSLLARAVQALSRAKQYSLETVQSDGHWNGELLSNATITAEYVFLYQSIGHDLKRDRKALVRHLLADQQADGSWAIAPNYPGDVSTTTEAYLALKILGLEEQEEVLSRARHFVLSCGGVAKVRIFTRFYLAMFGLFPWNAVPQLPPEMIFLPSQSIINIYTFSSWARSTVIPLSLVMAHQPTYPLPNGTMANNPFLDELWCEPCSKCVPYSANAKTSIVGGIFNLLDKALHATGGLKYNPLRPYARKRCVDWILSRQEKTGDWAGIFPPMHFGILALLLEGFSPQDAPVRLGLEAVERFTWQDTNGKRAQSCVSPVWDTILMTVGLCDAGMLPNDERLTKAMKWVKERQLLGQKGDWRVYNPNLAPGGFSFEYHNSWYPDVDDTAAAVIAFLKQDPCSIDTPAVIRAVDWMLGMQNRDGGWAAFDIGNDKLFLNEIPFSDMDSLCDPSTADVTGRVLEAFGMMLRIAYGQLRTPTSLIERLRNASMHGIQYLAMEQASIGAWYGRWGSNYIYGTSNVLCGLSYFSGSNFQVQNMMLRGARWLNCVQKADGSWGESLESYRDKSLAGQGPSTPSQTAWALMGLLACHETLDENIERAVLYLVDTQTDISDSGEGASWPEKEYTGTGFPNFFYLGYTLYRHYFVLMALGRYVTMAKHMDERTNDANPQAKGFAQVDSTHSANGNLNHSEFFRDLSTTNAVRWKTRQLATTSRPWRESRHVAHNSSSTNVLNSAGKAMFWFVLTVALAFAYVVLVNGGEG